MTKNIDYQMIKELGLVIDSEYEDYQREDWLAENYLKKWKKGKFDFKKAEKGVLNLIVTPRARKYQNQFNVNIGKEVRDAVAKQRLRRIMSILKEKEADEKKILGY